MRKNKIQSTEYTVKYNMGLYIREETTPYLWMAKIIANSVYNAIIIQANTYKNGDIQETIIAY